MNTGYSRPRSIEASTTRRRSVSSRPTYWVAISHRPMAIAPWASSLVRPEMPSERLRRSLVKSSAKPSAPQATAVPNTARLTAR